MFSTRLLLASRTASPLYRVAFVLVIVGRAPLLLDLVTGSPSPVRRWLSFSWIPPSSGRIDGSTRMVSPGCDAASTCSSVANGRLRLPLPPGAASAFTYQVEAASLAPAMDTRKTAANNTG